MAHSEVAGLTVLGIRLGEPVLWLHILRKEARLLLYILLVNQTIFTHLHLVPLKHNSGVITLILIILQLFWSVFTLLFSAIVNNFIRDL